MLTEPDWPQLVGAELAYRLGGQETTIASALWRAVSAPLTLAVVLGVGLNVASVELPLIVSRFLEPLGALVGPVVLLALGILFRPSLVGIDQVLLRRRITPHRRNMKQSASPEFLRRSGPGR